MKGDDFSSALSCLFFWRNSKFAPNQWVTYSQDFHFNWKLTIIPKICGFRHGGLQRWWKLDPFWLDRRVTSPSKVVWRNQKCCFEVLRLREITMKSPLTISFFWKKRHGNPDDWEIVGNVPIEKLDPSPWTMFHLMLKERWAPFDWSTRKTGIPKTENGIPWLWRRWWSGMVIPFPHQKARCFSMFFPLIKR